MKLVAAVVPMFVLCGCLSWMSAPLPMASVADPFPGPGRAKCLLVMLPGARDRAAVFREEGFVDAIRRSGLSIDLIAADATPGYYYKGILPQRLESDVIAPARAKGYEQVWLLGISIGGFGTFHYSQQFSEHVDGIAAFAPYLGDDKALQQIDAAGGLMSWKPPQVEPVTKENYTQQTWGWLHRVTASEDKRPQLYLGFGDNDGVLTTANLLIAALPEGHIFHAPGGHEWSAWRKLLDQFLARSDLKDRCAR